MSEEKLWRKIERGLESPAAFYGSTAIMLAVMVGVLVYWFGFYSA